MKKRLFIVCLLLSFFLTFSCSNSTSSDVSVAEPSAKKGSDIITFYSNAGDKYSFVETDLSGDVPYILKAAYKDAPCNIKKECSLYDKERLNFNGSTIKINSADSAFCAYYEGNEFPCKWGEKDTTISTVAFGTATDSVSKKSYALLKFVTTLSEPNDPGSVWSGTLLANMKRNSRNALVIQDIISFKEELISK